MIEVRKNELRVDEDVLKWATDKEMEALHEIVKAIAKRMQERGAITAFRKGGAQ